MKERTLNVRIKEVYLKEILKGVKKIEYRDGSNDYYINKLVQLDHPKYAKYGGDPGKVRDAIVDGDVEMYPQHYDTITFWCNDKVAKVRIKEIKMYKGHTTIAIHLGEILSGK